MDVIIPESTDLKQLAIVLLKCYSGNLYLELPVVIGVVISGI